MVHRQRRQVAHRNHIRCFLLAASIVLLIFFALFSFFAPHPVDQDERLHNRHRRISVGNNAKIELSAFFVPASGKLDHNLWRSRNSEFYYGCSSANKTFQKAKTVTAAHRYLLIVTSGGLNQQRTGITDAVVAARILNATLVVPKLDQKSFWKDSSDFSDIFDVEWFISHLSKDVIIIKELPKKGGKPWIPHRMRVPRKCSDRCYLKRVLPVLSKRHAIQITKFDYRLANRLEIDLQKMRCRVNYHALKFATPILEMGKELVNRMRSRSKHYIALHLRFEPDMLAFSGCYYGGGDKERKELGAIRKRWKTLHTPNPDKERRHGKCPLTPEEVGLVMRALGYGNDVHLYVASGEIFGGEKTLAPLKALFPNFHTKDSIASRELNSFSAFSSRMAALDFIVCDESDVFVTNNNGNMAKMLAGRRRYFGHKPTIRPNAKKLYRLFLNRGNLTWAEFSSKVQTYQKGFMGEPNEVRAGRGEFHENPSACICESPLTKLQKKSTPGKSDEANNFTTEEVDDQLSDDEPDPPPEDEEELDPLQDTSVYNETGLNNDGLANEENELEEMLSD
ncbi:hypothetical protein QQ045_026196 [Rhodiola kirilowii]